MPKQVTLTDSEAEIVRDVIQWWLDGNVHAKEDTAQDRVFDTPEEMLEMVAGYDESDQHLRNVLDKLRRQDGESSAA